MDTFQRPTFRDEIVTLGVPDNVTGFALDHPGLWCRDESLLGFIEVAGIRERQFLRRFLQHLERVFRRRLAQRVKVPALHRAGIGER